MFIVYGAEKDRSNFAVSDVPLKINSCGMNSTLKKSHRLSDTLYVRRPEGRKDFQLMYISMGRAEYCLGGSWHRVQAGQAILYWPEVPQFYLYRAGEPVECKWVHFSGTMACPLLRQCGFCPEEPILTLGEDREISQLYDGIIREMQLALPCHEAVAAALLCQLIGLMGRKRAIMQDEGDFETRQKLLRVVEHMHYHYDEPQTLDQYAAQCGMSRFHFAHAFRACFGKPPYEYLIALRMERARELIAGSEMPIGEIAKDCGYENPLYFTRAFSRHFHLPPTAYRKRFREAGTKGEGSREEGGARRPADPENEKESVQGI